MQFAVIAALIGAVAANSVTYVTEIRTITKCPATVTDCPLLSTLTHTTSYPVPAITDSSPLTRTKDITVVETITACPPSVTNCPVRHVTKTYPGTVAESAAATTVIYSQPASNTTWALKPTTAPVVDVTVTVTISACPATTPATIPTKAPSVPVVYPTTIVVSPSGLPAGPPSNGTTNPSGTGPTPPKFTGGAATLTSSLFVAGLAGLAAVVLA